MLPIVPVFLAAVVVHLLVSIVRCLRSPLRKIPGPSTQYVHSLHKKYGHAVRLAPNEASFTSYEAVKEIYCSSGSGYDKTEFYDLFRVYNRRTMFTTLNKDDHAKRKRILADRYANSNIMKPASLSGIEERSRKFVQRLQRSVEGHESHDIFMTLHAYACDCATHHLFNPYGTDCLQKKADEDMMHEVAADDSLKSRVIQHHYPTLYNTLSGVLDLFVKPRSVPLATNYVMSVSGRHDASTFTLLNRMQEKSAAGMQLDQTDMAGECLDHMAAGIDTTGDGLCFLMWELSQPSSLHFQRKLQAELRANPDVGSEKLPYLEAVIQESLRCFPPIPMSLPRYVPQGGRTIGGYFVPEKTVASCQAFSVHRINEHVFPDPDRFDPDRWMVAEGDAERKRLMFAFANGGRGCVGKHLALAEMKMLLRDVYRKYTTLPDPSMTPEMMVMADQAISSRPLGQKCLLQFLPDNTDSPVGDP